MEVAGLVAGIPGLFSACMDILERIDAYKEFGLESRRAVARFEADKLRLRKWASDVGISEGKWEDMHDSRLKDHDLETVVKRILNSACEIFDATERTRSQLRIHPEETNKPFPSIPDSFIETKKNKGKASSQMSIRGGLGWAVKRRGKFNNQVDMFQGLVDTLYDLFPPQKASSPTDHVRDEQNQGRSGSASIQNDIQSLLEAIQRTARQQAQTAINDWLDITKFDEQYNVSQHYEKQKLSRLEGTCEWIFSNPEYCAWASEDFSDEKARFLWIYGPPGHGKTVLCARLIEHFKDKRAFPVAYFFSSAHAQSGGQPNAIVRCWVGQIARVDSNALDLVRGYFEQSETGRIASETEIWSVFGSIISQKRDYTFFLDGFDEYSRLDDARAQFLQSLKKAAEGTGTRVCISSRDESDIKTELLPETSQTAGQIRLACRISVKEVRDDITSYSRSVVDKKLSKKDEAVKQDLARQLAEKCEGMFLWIRLQQDQLRSYKNRKQLQNIVENMPSGLHKTYERNWITIQDRDLDEQKRALAILRWATFALRPLTVSEIIGVLVVKVEGNSARVHLDELPDTVDDDYIKDGIIDICGYLVEVREKHSGDEARSRTIHLIHPSVSEFLLSVLPSNSELAVKHSLLPDQKIDQSEQHNYLATICLAYLNDDDSWSLRGADAFFEYAGRYWHSHMNTANKVDVQVIKLVNEFLRAENESFIRWTRMFESWGDSAGTPLYYAALFNLIPSMKFIWENERAQLNSVGGQYGTPLQAACAKGHLLAFNTLIDWGADPNVEGGQFGAPLHAAIAGGHQDMVESLVNIGASLTFQDSSGQTPLYIASEYGYPAIVKFLLDAGAKPDTGKSYGWTPLHSAASYGHLEVVKLLLDQGADFTVSSNEGWTPMHSAAQDGHLEVVKLLLDRADVNVSSNKGWTPMHLAADNGHLEVVKLLLDRADVNVSTNEGWTPMHLAARNGHLEVVKLLLDRADVNVSTNEGWTPMHLAADNGHLEVVKLLLDRADVNVSTNEGWTPMHLAADNGHLEVVKLLLDRADVNVSTNEGWTPMHLAAQNGHLEVVKLLLDRADVNVSSNEGWTPMHLAAQDGHLEVVKLLLDRADVNVSSNEGWTPMHLAARDGHLEVVKLLLDRADVNVSSNEGWTPMHLAARDGHLEVVKLLLDRADVNVSSNEGWTPMHLAAQNGHLEVIKLLLNQGADVKVSNNEGCTPLYWAAYNGNLEVIKLLLDRGADATVLNDNEHMSLHSVAPEESFELPEIPLLSRSSSASQSRTADRGVISMNLLSSPLQTSEEPLSSTIDVNALDGPYGTIVHTAAYKGHLKMLQMLVERYNADIIVTDQFGRSLLHVAAGGGNIDCVNYLLDRGLRCSDKDNDGNDVFHYACSGASIKVVRRILELDPPVIDSFSTWTPLHWACRTGDGELIQLLLSHGFRTSSVHTKIPSASWTPMSIGVFHRNPNSESDIHQSVLEGKKDHGSSYKGFFPSSESSLVVRGSHHAEIWCNKCFHYIYGTRFRCQDCVDFDLCFMCMLTEKPHPGHSWEEIESEEP